MAEKVREFKGGPGARGRGPRPKVANPGKLFKRIMQYVMRKYTVHIAVVVICIFVGVLASVRGTLPDPYKYPSGTLITYCCRYKGSCSRRW